MMELIGRCRLSKVTYYVQNADALQPSTLAPWWERFGHSLDAVDIDGDGIHDFMIQIGGFTPDP